MRFHHLRKMAAGCAWSRRRAAWRAARVLACGLALLAFGGCRRRSAVREYTEMVTAPPPGAVAAPGRAGAAAAPAKAVAPVRWQTPEGWQESAGGGMRLATFAIPDEQGAGTCTIVALGGQAGGLEANVRRWIEQLDLPVPPDEELQAFLNRQETFETAVQTQGVLVDLMQLPGAAGRTQDSMLVASIPLHNQTIFVKFTGRPALLQRERTRFLELCQSVGMGT